MSIESGVVLGRAKKLFISCLLALVLAACSAADDGSSSSGGTASSSTNSASGGSSSGGSSSSDDSTATTGEPGVPDNLSFSIAADTLNPEGLNWNGEEIAIIVQLGDETNSYVVDGTEVFFEAEFGVIESSCTTVSSSCSVTWKSGEPRSPLPFRDSNVVTRTLFDGGVSCGNLPSGIPCSYDNRVFATPTVSKSYGGLGQVYGNRVSIIAYVKGGEETFADTDGDGFYSEGEAFSDIGEPFFDYNEDDVFGGKLADGTAEAGAAVAGATCYNNDNVCYQEGGDNETYIDENDNGSFDSSGNGKYNGALCLAESDFCTKSTVTLWSSITILQSGSDAFVGVYPLGSDKYLASSYSTFINLNTTPTLVVAVSDFHNGRLPSGTQIKMTTTNGAIADGGSCEVSNSSSTGFTTCVVEMNPDTTSSSGFLHVEVTTPNDTVSDYYRTLID